ncbi:MAG TPA: ABC transporter permease [Candidatus Limnocylindrales bacterium]|nr:ABC transporter permease [Candidatus Limnocylindrales bacterium]
MKTTDLFRFSWRSFTTHRIRAALMLLAMSIGVGAVVIVTSLGEGARRYVTAEFATLGTNLVLVFPGRSETAGATPGMLIARSARDLTINDAESLLRVRWVTRVSPVAVGTAEAKKDRFVREVPVVGTNAAWLPIRRMEMAEGTFLPEGDPEATTPVCVLGQVVRSEFFGNAQAVGSSIRLGDRKFRVIGVLAARGQGLGMNTDEMVIVPAGAAQALFNSTSLFRIIVEVTNRNVIDQVRGEVENVLAARHQGERDVTVLTQDAVLATFDTLLVALTLAITAIASISLVVAGVLITNLMLISVSQRRAEIGLLKALGASQRQIRTLFLSEGAVISGSSGIVGILAGEAGVMAIRAMYPVFPAFAPVWTISAALVAAVIAGTLFSLLPARRAALLDPILALARR